MAGEPPPNPEPDEWQFAVGLSRQISHETYAAYDRYRQVVELLVSLLERGILRAALRPFFLGEPVPLPPCSWCNEVFFSWFATCQVDVERPFTGIPVRGAGHWIVFEAQSFYAWVVSVERCTSDQSNSQGAPDMARQQTFALKCDGPVVDIVEVMTEPAMGHEQTWGNSSFDD